MNLWRLHCWDEQSATDARLVEYYSSKRAAQSALRRMLRNNQSASWSLAVWNGLTSLRGVVPSLRGSTFAAKPARLPVWKFQLQRVLSPFIPPKIG